MVCLESYIDCSPLERCLECFKLICCASEDHYRPESLRRPEPRRLAEMSCSFPPAGVRGERGKKGMSRNVGLSSNNDVRSDQEDLRSTSAVNLYTRKDHVDYFGAELPVAVCYGPMIYRAAISLPARCQSRSNVAKFLQVVAEPDTACSKKLQCLVRETAKFHAAVREDVQRFAKCMRRRWKKENICFSQQS